MDTQKSAQTHDWHPADVVAALRKRGTSLRKVAHENGYTHIQAVLTRPWWVVEQIVAQALELSPQAIWPSRYADGVSREHAMTRAERRQNRQAGSGNPFGLRRRLGPGWSDRHVQRMAAKRRAVRRHRAATRGRA